MDKVNCKTITNEDNSIIEIEGLRDDKIIINYESDIDFTILVSTLTELIDKEPEVIFENEISEDMSDKTKLVLATLDDIFDSYNKSISSENDEEKIVQEQIND